MTNANIPLSKWELPFFLGAIRLSRTPKVEHICQWTLVLQNFSSTKMCTRCLPVNVPHLRCVVANFAFQLELKWVLGFNYLPFSQFDIYYCSVRNAWQNLWRFQSLRVPETVLQREYLHPLWVKSANQFIPSLPWWKRKWNGRESTAGRSWRWWKPGAGRRPDVVT